MPNKSNASQTSQNPTPSLAQLKNADATAIQEAMDGLNVMALSRNLSLVLELPEQDVQIQADADRVGQILYNLISNGLKYTGDEGHVRVSLQGEDGDAVIKVSGATGQTLRAILSHRRSPQQPGHGRRNWTIHCQDIGRGPSRQYCCREQTRRRPHLHRSPSLAPAHSPSVV